MSIAAVPSPQLILIGGGARSGKSRFALGRALALGDRRVFIATAEALDHEMAQRIDRHRLERGGSFRTIEEPLALGATLDQLEAVDVILVDCLTLWVSNLLLGGRASTPEERGEIFDSLLAALERRRAHVLLVSNEVGMGVVPDHVLGREFRDAMGDLHQRLTSRATEIYAAVMGLVLRLHPAPVAMVIPSHPATQAAEPEPRHETSIPTSTPSPSSPPPSSSA